MNSTMNIRRSRIVAIFILAVSLMTFLACLISVLDGKIYDDAVSAGVKVFVVGALAQDIIFIPLAVLLALLSVIYLIKPSFKVFIAMLGFTGNFFYGYGLYVMEAQYTALYLVYLAIFSLSLYSLIFGLLSFTRETDDALSFPKALRVSTSVFMYLIVVMLGFVWLTRVMSDIAQHTPQITYAVYILDLGIVFPAIAVSATRLIARKAFGLILTGVMLVKILTVCLSWGFGEVYSRLTGAVEGAYDMLTLPSVLTLISLVFFIFYLAKLKRTDHKAKEM